MDIYQALGYKLTHATAVTAITGTAAIYHGFRPQGSTPCINYFEVGYIPLHNGVLEAPRYQISCRASSAETAQQLAREVCVVLHNMQESVSGFDVQRTTIEGKLLLPEPDTNLYHVPVDVRFVYNESTVS